MLVVGSSCLSCSPGHAPKKKRKNLDYKGVALLVVVMVVVGGRGVGIESSRRWYIICRADAGKLGCDPELNSSYYLELSTLHPKVPSTSLFSIEFLYRNFHI
jgi:hypothetical protein